MLLKSSKSVLPFSILMTLIISVGVFLLLRQETTSLSDPLVFAHDKGLLPGFQESFEKQGKQAKEITGYEFVPVPSQTTDLYINQMRAALPTKNAPELFVWWSTYRVGDLVENNLVDDLTDLWDKYKNEYNQGIRNAYTFNDKVYGFPYSIEYWAVWYNKTIFKRLGLQEPDTWEEFLVTCEVLKTNGIPPVLNSLQHSWYAFVWFEEMIIGQDPDLYVDLCEGRARYTDPRVKAAMKVWADMIIKGYFTDPTANMFTNSAHLWNREKFGMVLCGSWYYASGLANQGVAPDTIGVFILPSHNSLAGKNIAMESGPVFTAKNAPNRKAARVVADWWMSSRGNEHFSKTFKSYTANTQSNSKHLPVAKQQLLTKITDNKYRVLNRYWEATPAPICEAAVEKLGEFIINPDTLDEVLEEIETVATNYWQSKKKL